MRLKCSPDIAQAAMENVLSDIDNADVYIDDVGAFSNDWDHHVDLVATILLQLHEIGFTINPLECEWAIKETDRLAMPQKCTCLLAALFIIVTCG
jgi:hypothetical protein